MKRVIAIVVSAAVWLCATVVISKSFTIHGGKSGGNNPVVLLPLVSSASLSTNNSGTLTFSNWQTEKGWELQSNSNDIYVFGTAACNATLQSGSLNCTGGPGIATYVQYNSQLPNVQWPNTQCLVDKYTAQTTSVGAANTGAFTTPDGAVWAWGTANGVTNFNITRNGIVIFLGETLVEMTDGSVFTRKDDVSWWGYVPSVGQFLGWGTAEPTVAPNSFVNGGPMPVPNAGKWQKSVNCPAGLPGSANYNAYVGPCDLVTGGCAASYSLARAMTSNYSGKLFQLVLVSNGSTIDVGQTANHIVDMSTWSAFCGGVQSNCAFNKIYDHSGNSNTLLPSTFNAPSGPNCSGGTLYKCACPFVINASTGYPELVQSGICEYTLGGDVDATGLTSGTSNVTVAVNAAPTTVTNICCQQWGRTHLYNAPDTPGTDFGLVMAYGTSGLAFCAVAGDLCIGIDQEGLSTGVTIDYSRAIINIISAVTLDTTGTVVTDYINESKGHSATNSGANSGKKLHLFGGGDLSQPASGTVRDFLVSNTTWAPQDMQAFLVNEISFYSSLSFPATTALAHLP